MSIHYSHTDAGSVPSLFGNLGLVEYVIGTLPIYADGTEYLDRKLNQAFEDAGWPTNKYATSLVTSV